VADELIGPGNALIKSNPGDGSGKERHSFARVFGVEARRPSVSIKVPKVGCGKNS